ncbi:MAG: epimerase [Nitrospirales bacterium]|nr:MAG: epimerase [Nitrospirales bacterium]
MNIIVAGGTGFIGHHVSQTMIENQHDVTVLSRNPAQSRDHVHREASITDWDTLRNKIEETTGGVDAIINLAGTPIADARWTSSRKQLLIDSRVETTRRLVETIGSVSIKPKTLINASGIGFYGADKSITMTESSPPGEGFLAELSQKWEREAYHASDHGVRVICLRMGMVLGSDGGALSKMKTPFKLFVGGPIAPGTQKVSWIHLDDLARLMMWLLDKPTLSGPINAVAPQFVSMSEFCKRLGEALHRPSWLPVPAFALNVMLGELAEMLTTGQQVEPRTITQEGFSFRYPNLREALQSLFVQQES